MTRLIACLLLVASGTLRAQEFTFPFQNPALSEDERLDNAVSLMTVDEKIMTVVGQGVQRLGIAGPGATEAIHGIVRGGDSEL
ncbi:MAG: beta-glucosidase, partial [Bacteroidales bacterium]|nr:beta-glucosidase [Bacteroidales bacterium]